jgi:hypothetical protein
MPIKRPLMYAKIKKKWNNGVVCSIKRTDFSLDRRVLLGQKDIFYLKTEGCLLD